MTELCYLHVLTVQFQVLLTLTRFVYRATLREAIK
jgi:hypothetical protein